MVRPTPAAWHSMGMPHSQGLANVAWAFARSGLRHDQLLASLAKRAAQPEVLRSFTPQGIANVAWAYATLDFFDEPLMMTLGDYIGQRAISGFNSQVPPCPPPPPRKQHKTRHRTPPPCRPVFVPRFIGNFIGT